MYIDLPTKAELWYPLPFGIPYPLPFTYVQDRMTASHLEEQAVQESTYLDPTHTHHLMPELHHRHQNNKSSQ